MPAHVTVLFPFLPATAVDDAVRHGLREIAGLPVRTVVREVVLLEFDGARWRRRASFALAPGAGGARTLTRCPGP
ncbi:hypothetical protein SAMN04324258_1229 [Krasilnikoviella flava]|uniref:2'-5' RNA ligase superfamily protein n=1 Tax=Krasilnikoviella flava TaxID=526729 RepID=A0A1T5JBP8_9MICO|nr:hypothetical protein SAMN04324258_1229 [Krasilnikoviella flava]